jgi:ABC-2 type transport system permease protein
MVEDTVKMAREASFYLGEFGGFQSEGESEESVVAQSARMARESFRARRWLSGNLEVKTEQVADKQKAPERGFANQILPGLLLMGLLFAASGLSTDWWKERQDATLRRVLASPRGVLEVTAGKLLAYAVIAGVLAAAGLGLGHALMGLQMKSAAAAIAWTTLVGCVAYLSFLLLQSLISNQRGAEMLVSLILMPSCMLGGCFFPLSMMPAKLAVIGARTPVGVAATTLIQALEGAAPWTAIGAGLAVVVGLTALLAWRVRTRFVF